MMWVGGFLFTHPKCSFNSFIARSLGMVFLTQAVTAQPQSLAYNTLKSLM